MASGSRVTVVLVPAAILLASGFLAACAAAGKQHAHETGRTGTGTGTGRFYSFGSNGQLDCANQHLITGWTLVVSGHNHCAPSAHALQVFRAYLQTPACLGRPGPSGMSCVARGGYRCATFNWQDFSRIKTLVQCFTFAGRVVPKLGPRKPFDLTAWSPRSRH